MPPHHLEILGAAGHERQFATAVDASEQPLDCLRMAEVGDVEAGVVARSLENSAALHPHPPVVVVCVR